MAWHGDSAAAARRSGLTALLLLLGVVGALTLCSGVLPSFAGAAKCVDCEGEEPGEEAEAQILTIQIQGPGSVATTTKTVCENTGGGLKICELEVAEGKQVTLSATPQAGFAFMGWSGACSGTGTCEVTMAEPKSVIATFADKTPPTPPTITSPSDGSHFDVIAEAPMEITFNNSGDASAVAFLCSLDNPSPGVPCSSPWTTPKLSSGDHTVYVWAKDAAGNISSPDSTTFFFGVFGSVEEPPKEEGSSGSAGGTTTLSGTGTQSPPPPKIAARLIAKWRFDGDQTIFRKLALKLLPAGAKVVATCTGKGCPFKRKQPKVKAGVADLSAQFADRELSPGVLIKLKVNAPGMIGQTIELKTRAGKPPKVTKR